MRERVREVETPPTPYADVNATLDALLDGAQSALGDNLIGLYLFGSLALGDFDYESSDIDFVAALAQEPDAQTMASLTAMHERLATTGGLWATKLEGAYIPTAALRRYDPANARHPVIIHIQFDTVDLGGDWIINRYILRKCGVTLYGPPPATLIDPISPAQLTGAVRDLLCNWWSQFVDGPEWMRSRDEQAFTVLTMCRALYALEYGEIVSKPVAARWAEEHLAPEWTPLIRQSLEWRREDSETEDEATLQETLRFLRFAVGQARLLPERDLDTGRAAHVQ